MLKMIIRMDEAKIAAEHKYPLGGIYRTLHRTFAAAGLARMEDATGALVYRDCGRAADFSQFGRVVNALKRQEWFMENVAVWSLCDSDDADGADGFNEEDLLSHYREHPPLRS